MKKRVLFFVLSIFLFQSCNIDNNKEELEVVFEQEENNLNCDNKEKIISAPLGSSQLKIDINNPVKDIKNQFKDVSNITPCGPGQFFSCEFVSYRKMAIYGKPARGSCMEISRGGVFYVEIFKNGNLIEGNLLPLKEIKREYQTYINQLEKEEYQGMHISWNDDSPVDSIIFAFDHVIEAYQFLIDSLAEERYETSICNISDTLLNEISREYPFKLSINQSIVQFLPPKR